MKKHKATPTAQNVHTIALRTDNIMKSSFRKLIISTLASCAILGAAVQGYSQITVKVDSTKPWIGYMNVFNLPAIPPGPPYGAFQFGSSWGIADLVAVFTGTSYLTLTPNTIGDPNPYWYTPSGGPGATGNKIMDANLYVQTVDGTFTGQTVTFTGTVQANTLVSPYTSVAFIKDFAPDYSSFVQVTAPLTPGTFSISLDTINDPSRHVQYGFETIGPNVWVTDVAAKGSVKITVDNADPSITGQPASTRTVFGGSASFTVSAVGGSPLSYQWKRYGTNLVNSPGKFAGATSATLNISNAQADDGTTYTVTVSDSSPTPQTSTPASLSVLTPAQFANSLDNPSFELNVTAPAVVPAPWYNFSGSALQNTNDLYAFTSGAYVQTVEGTNVVQVYNAGQYNGIYQDVPAVPGQIFTGDCWLWQSSLDSLLAPTNEAFMEVQFWASGGGAPIAIYHSNLITNSPAMLDTWLFLEATNGVPAGYASTSTSNAKYLVAPAGTGRVRTQITLHTEGNGGGSVYVDVMRLMNKIPVTLTSTFGGGNINISWLSQGATSYQVVYKDNLTDASWTPIGGLIAGDGGVKTVSFPASPANRFYSVLTK